jgi:AraC-like ligand binding domain
LGSDLNPAPVRRKKVMSLTFIDTNHLPKKASTGHGEVVEVLNNALCGAHNVHGSVRWLKSGETFEPEAIDKHQLIYLMDGAGRVRLDNKDYDVEKGAILDPQKLPPSAPLTEPHSSSFILSCRTYRSR